MSVINVLPKQVAELIAAGEVIERPASVIKELVENAIDAGARCVTVEIKNGGVTFMRVTDDGIGFQQEDVRNAFLRHATSKIAVPDDLDSITTLGFRGEALASICAVSKVELMTRHRDEPTGTIYRLEGGEETAFLPADCPQGTTFVVRELFFNVPARMKFLKKDATESASIASLMDRMALSHPEIAFTFIRDGRQTMKTSGKGDLATTTYQVFGKQFYEGLLPVSYQYQGITVNGYVSKPTSANRASRAMQLFFVNGRYVRTKTGMAAVEQAYKGFIMVGKYPACVLNLQMDCSTLDVNVHPAKLEIRFTNERPVYDSVYHSVRTALSSYDTRDSQEVPLTDTPTDPRTLGKTADKGEQLDFASAARTVPSTEEPPVFMPTAADYKASVSVQDSAALAHSFEMHTPVTIRPINLAEYRRQQAAEHTAVSVSAVPATVPPLTETGLAAETTDPSRSVPPAASSASVSTDAPAALSAPTTLDAVPVPSPPVEFSDREPDVTQAFPALAALEDDGTMSAKPQEGHALQYIGEAFLTYLIVQYDSDRLMLIDKHAAHERLIYERLKQTAHDTEPQLLLEPIRLTLDKNEYATVIEHQSLLAQAGFEVEDFGVGTVLLRGVPLMLEKLDVTETFLEVAQYLTHHKRVLLSEKMEWIYANTACRSAIKAGDRNRPEELIALVKELEQHPTVRYCPHGRPIYYFLTRSEIEKSFKRI